MTLNWKNIFASAAVALTFGASAANATVILDNSPSDGSFIFPFGSPDTQTYGEVFTAPVTGQLTSFTLWLNDGVVDLYGGVGTWNGPSTFALGFGSPSNLYQSAGVPSVGPSAYTFFPNISVVAGQQYVAYLSVFGDGLASGNTTMPLSINGVSGIDYFVFNNSTAPQNNASWNYFTDFGNAQFAATFETPEPGPLSLVLFGSLALLGLAWGRRRGAV